jgi:hypothetical protein
MLIQLTDLEKYELNYAKQDWHRHSHPNCHSFVISQQLWESRRY